MDFSVKHQEPRKTSILYHSQHPQYQKSCERDYKQMRFSLLSLDGNYQSSLQKSVSQSNNLSYKYKRVDNMFKLVSVNQENCEDKNQNTQKFASLELEIKNLSSRISELERKESQKSKDHFQSYLQGIHQEMTWLTERDREIQIQMNTENQQIKERLEQMEEQISSEEDKFSYIKQNMFKFEKMLESQSSSIEQKVIIKLQSLMDQYNAELKERMIKIEAQLEKNKQKYQPWNITLNSCTETSSKSLKADKKPLFLKHRQSYEVVNSKSQYLVQQNIYRIDSDGKLLDDRGYKILDKNNKQITINPQHIKMLESFGILHSPEKNGSY